MKTLLLTLTLIILSTTLFALLQAQTIPDYIPTDGLVAWYPFNGNANDESGNGNNGTVNGATLTTDKDGNENSAYSFDGVDDYIEMDNSGPANTGISLSYWFKSEDFSDQGVVSYGGSGWGEWFEVRHNHYSAQNVNPCYGPSFSAGGTLVSRGLNTKFDSSSWNHIVVVLPESATDLKAVQFYWNGVLQSEICSFANYGAPSPNISTANPIRLGYGNPQGGDWLQFFDGQLDEVLFYNRALTEEEIRNIYYEGNPPVPPSYIPQDDLIAWYPFNGNANDESGNGNNGTVNGAVLTTDKDGNENSAYSFDGVDDVIKVYDDNLNLDSTDFTISFWYTVESYSLANRFLLVKSDGQGETNKWIIQQTAVENGGPSLTFHVNGETTKSFLNADNKEDTLWHHVLITRDEQSLKIFLDGVLKETLPTIYIPKIENEFRIGGEETEDPSDGWHQHHGKIDNIAIWTRVLTDAEIENVYHQKSTQLSKLSSRSLQVDSSYTKRGFKFSNYVSLDTLAASDSLISYQFDLDIPDGITYDSLRVFHSESTPSVTTNYVDGTLTVVTTGSGFITTYDPMLELFYTSDTTGTYSLTPTNVVLNTTNITNISSGVMKIDPFIKGDVDDSGVIQAYDASIILHQSVGSEILKPDPVKDWEVGPWFNWRDAAADVDEDGDILALDASYIAQYVAGVITEFPTSTPQVESVIIEVTDRGLKVTAPESIQSLNIELPATDQVEFRDPEMSWNNSSVAMNKAEGMRVAVSSSEQVSGEVMEIPLYVYTNDNITLEVTTITNNTKKVHQVMVSGLTVNSEVTTGLPEKYTLSQNYPNPFNPSTQIQYALPEATQVTLEVFNSVGQKVMELVNGQKSAGYHTATFDASGLSSGVYLYKLTTPSFSQTNKMLLIK